MKILNKSLTALMLVLSCFANAEQNITFDESDKLYEVLPEKVQLQNIKDKNIVRFYFSFDCPYCKRSHAFIEAWGRSLPKGLTYEMHSVITPSDESQMLAYAMQYIKEKPVSEKAKNKFVHLIYKHAHKIQNDQQLSRLIKEALVTSKVGVTGFLKSVSDGAYEKSLDEQVIKQHSYDINVTPTVVIGGKYKTHLGFANGDTSRFIEIINAVTSIYIQEKGVKF